MKIATWNVNSLKVRLPQVLDWLEAEHPDVLCMQEIKMVDADFPHTVFEELGYCAQVCGQKTYNGVATISKLPQTDCLANIPGFEDLQRRVLTTTIGGVKVVNVYVPNGQEVGSDKFAYKLDWLSHMRTYLKNLMKAHSKVVVLGDFNVAPSDEDVYDPKKWEGSVLCSEPERKALRAIMDLGFKDAFRLMSQPEGVYSWWDYRTFAFVGNRGLRIDLVLVTDALASAVQKVWVDIKPRALPRPSDHAPVSVNLKLAEG